jgi:hypothetical protein
MPGNLSDTGRKQRIDHVIGYIFANSDNGISLQTFVGVANYCPDSR